MLAATGFAGALGFLFKILMSRMLTPGQFASYYSLFSFFTIFSVPALTVSMSVSRMTSGLKAVEDYPRIASRLRAVFRKTLLVSLPGFFLLIPAAFLLSGLFRLAGPGPLYITMAAILAFLPLNAGYGGLQGLQKFRWWGSVMAAVAAVRLIAGAALVRLGLGVGGAVGGSFVSMLAGAALVMYPLRFLRKAPDSRENVSLQAPGLSRIFPALFLTAYLGFGDMLLVQHFFSPSAAAVFGAASIPARAVFYAALPVSMALYPKAAYASSRGLEPGPVLARAVLTYLLFSCTLSVILFAANDFAGRLFYPREAESAAGIVKLFGFAFIPMGLNLVLVQYNLALQRGGVIACLFFSALAHFLIIQSFHSTAGHVQASIFAGGLFGSILLWMFSLGAGKWRFRLPGLPGGRFFC